MLEPKPNTEPLDASKRELIDELWALELSLGENLGNGNVVENVAADFISFDELGEAIAKSDFDQLLAQSERISEPKLLWAHFGSEDSCCLAYLRPMGSEKPTVCMALWINRDGEWQKVFHHKNTNYS